jgi:hypothetical protein
MANLHQFFIFAIFFFLLSALECFAHSNPVSIQYSTQETCRLLIMSIFQFARAQVPVCKRNFHSGLHLRLRGGAPPKGGKGAKGGAKDTAAKAAGGAGKEAPVEARADVAFPEERLEDQPAESGARHEFWVWSQNLKKEYEDGTREISEELLEKKSRSSKTLSVCTMPPSFLFDEFEIV